MSERDDEKMEWLKKTEGKLTVDKFLEELIPVFIECFEGNLAIIKNNQLIYYMPNGQKFQISAKEL